MKNSLLFFLLLLAGSVFASDSELHQHQAGGPTADRKTSKWNEIALLPWKDGSGIRWNAAIRVCDNLAIYDPATQTLTMGTNTVTDILPEDVPMVDVIVRDVASVVDATQAHGGKPGWC